MTRAERIREFAESFCITTGGFAFMAGLVVLIHIGREF